MLRAGSEVGHFAEFAQDHLIQSIDQFAGKPLTLEPFQVRFMDEALSYDAHGYPLYNSIILVLSRKCGKTHLLAGYAIWRLLTSDGSPEILLAASSDKQAGRLFDACVSFIQNSEYLSDVLRVRAYDGEIVRNDGRGRILRVASDPKRLQGYNPSLVVCDELGSWTTPGLESAFAALTSAGGARSAPQVFSITTPGDWTTRHDSILGRVVDAAQNATDKSEEPGLLTARIPEAKMLAYIYEAPTRDRKDTKKLKLANPASWITLEYLAEQGANPNLSDADVLQLHGCVWTSHTNSFLRAGAWRAVERAQRVPEGPVVLAFDGSYSRDASALLGCTTEGHIFVVKVWEKPTSAPDGWRVPRQAVHGAVDKAMEEYEVIEFAADPPGWHSELDEWETRYGDVVVHFETNQPKRMSPAINRFETAVYEKKLSHDGNPILARHLANCLSEDRRDGKALKKPHATKKIDAAVCAVIAFDRAMWHANKPAFDVTTLVW